MLTSFLIVAGIAAGGAILIHGGMAAINGIRNRNASKPSTTSTPSDEREPVQKRTREQDRRRQPGPKPVEEKTEKKDAGVESKVTDVETARKVMQEKIDALKAANEKIEEMIRAKVEAMELDPNTEEHKNVLIKTLLISWNNTYDKAMKHMHDIKEDLHEGQNFDEILARATLSPEVFLKKADSTLIPKASAKYAYYEGTMKKISAWLDKVDGGEETKMPESKRFVDGMGETMQAEIDSVKKLIVNPNINVDGFRLEADRLMTNVQRMALTFVEINSISEKLSTSLTKIEGLDKSTAKAEDVKKALDDLAKELEKNKGSVGVQDLSKITSALDKLEKDFGKLRTDIPGVIGLYKKEVEGMIDAKIKEALGDCIKKIEALDKSTAKAADVKKELDSLGKEISGVKEKVALIDLAKIEKALAQMQKDFGQLDERLSKQILDYQKNIEKMIDAKITAAMKGVMKTQDFDSYKKQVEELLKGFKDKLDAVDLLELRKKLEELTEAYKNVGASISEEVVREVAKAKKELGDALNAGIGNRISTQLKKKFKDFDLSYRKEVVEKVIEEVLAKMDTSIDAKINEDEFINKVIAALQITRKK